MGADTRVRAAHRRLSGPALVAAAVALGAPAGVWAAPGFTLPVDVSPEGVPVTAPRAAVASDGSAIVLWQRPAITGSLIQASTRAPGGAFTMPVDLSVPGRPAATPQVAADGAGGTVAVWRRSDGVTDVIQAATRPAGGAFGPPVTISPTGLDSSSPQVAVGADGEVVVAWLAFRDGDVVVQAAVRPAGGAFGPPVDLSARGGNAFAPHVAVGGGRAVVAWTRSDGAYSRIQASIRPSGGGFAAPVDVSSPGGDAFGPRVAVDAAGGAVVAWSRLGGGWFVAQAATATPGGGFGPAADLSAPGADAEDLQVATDAAGGAVVAWRRGAGDARVVQAATRAPGGAFGAAADVSGPDGPSLDPALDVAPDGTALVAWRRESGGDSLVQAAVGTTGGAFGAPEDLSAPGRALEPRVALADGGDGVVTWRRSDGAAERVQAAGFDASGPDLGRLLVPATATAGVPVQLAVEPVDAWSPLSGVPAWDLGDGATAAGRVVSHAYAAPGTYTLRVSQSDVLGNTGSATTTVTVLPAPAPAAAPAAAPARPAGPVARRPVAFRASLSVVRRGGTTWLRTRGRAGVALAGERVVIQRRVKRLTLPLCRIRVRPAGGFDGRCRIDRLTREPRLVLRVRARLAPTRTTLGTTSRYVTLRIPLRRAARGR